jgi:hypothetical protein
MKLFLALLLFVALVTIIGRPTITARGFGITTAAGGGPSSPTIDPWSGPCDTADVLNLLAKKRLEQKNADPIYFIRGRIAACQAMIASYLSKLPSPTPIVVISTSYPSPAPNPTGPALCASPSTTNIEQLYNILGYCVAWVKNIPAVAATTPTPQPLAFRIPPSAAESPGAHIQASAVKMIYAMALATDAPTSAQLSFRLATHLEDALNRNVTIDLYTGQHVVYEVVAQPTWSLGQYQQQCFNDSSTAGAVVILPPSAHSGSWNYLLASSWTEVAFQAIVLDCEPTNALYTNNASYVTWISNVQRRDNSRYSLSLSTILALLSGIAAIHPVHTETETTTYSVATPSPGPSPGSTYVSGSMTSDATSSNPNGFGALAGAGVAALTPLASTSLGEGGAVDTQTGHAAEHAIHDLVAEMQFDCKYITDPVPCEWLLEPTPSP